MRPILIILLFCFSLSVIAQSVSEKDGYVAGTVLDKNDNEPIYGAIISLLQPGDSTFIQGTTTDSIGQFRLKLDNGRYILTAYYMGYKKRAFNIESTNEKPDVRLGNIIFEDNAILLGEAIVVGDLPPIVVKGDTIEYNSESFKPDENAYLRDLINNIPGMEVDEHGNITANGKPVVKILVDGKEFFGNDIPLALANLPANMIKKLQLFKDESESAKITGFKDNGNDQVLNLVVKDELKKSIFGKAIGAYGSDDRYKVDFNLNYMRNETQATLLGRTSNVTNSPMNMNNGEDKERSLGTSFYLNPVENMKLGIYSRISENDHLTESKSNTQTYLENGDRFSKQAMRNNSKNDGFDFGFNFIWEADSMTTIFARSNIGLRKDENENKSQGISYTLGESDTTFTSYNTLTKGDGYNVNSSITAGRKLNSEGRAVSLTFDQSTRDNNNKGTNNSLTEYVGPSAKPHIQLDQRTKTDSKSDSYGFAFSYVEPITDNNLLQFSYNYNKMTSDNDRNTWKKDHIGNYTVLDSAYTRKTTNKYITQNIGLEFQSTKEKYNYTIGFSVDPSSSKSNVWLLDSLIDEVKQNVVNYSPSFRFSYNPTSSSSLDVNYFGSTSQASSSQLSADTTIINASNKYYGNPDLKPSYNNTLDISYQKSDYEVGSFIFVSAVFDYTFNQIASYSIIDVLGNTENTYRNVNGNLSANLSGSYNTPLKNKKFTVSTSMSVNYTRSVGFTNEKKAITNNYVIGDNLMGKFKSKLFETITRIGATFNIAKNNLSEDNEQNTAIYTLQNQSTLNLPYDISLHSNVRYTLYSGYGDEFKKNEILWNMSVSKKFLKGKKGLLKFEIFDILNDRNNLSRVVTSGYSSDTRTNSLNRYFLVSFSYQFNIFKGGKDNNGNDPYI